ncbi:MAG: hypothetical protein ACRD8A_02325 [Candidatus Acidiferrales bacterium]
MKGGLLIFGLLAAIALLCVKTARAQADPKAASAPPGITQTVDGIAARIEGDIITDSEVRELAALQQLANGKPKPRDEIIRELADQWVVRQEAAATRYQEPSQTDVNQSYEQLVKNFASPADFQAHLATVGLSDVAVRRLLHDQLYLSRFLDYRFRPTVQISDQQVQDYYNNVLVPELKKHSENVPPLNTVDDKIREVLIQRAIDDRAAKWLDETRSRLNIQILPQGDAS